MAISLVELLPSNPSRILGVNPPRIPVQDTTASEREHLAQESWRKALDERFPPDRVLTLPEVQALIEGCGAPNFPFPIGRIHCSLDDRFSYAGGVTILLKCNVRVWDRLAPTHEISLTFSEQKSYPDFLLTRGFVLKEIVWRFLQKIIEHELAESLLVHGVRVFDPHRLEVENTSGQPSP